MSQDQEPGWQRPDDEVSTDPTPLDTQHADLVAYCRAVTGREDEAVGTAQAVLDSAHSLLSDPDQLRAWLFALARMEILAGSEPQSREIFDLVHQYGILPEDLPVVLGIPPAEADQLLAAAEAEYGEGAGPDNPPGWDDSTQLMEGQPDPPAAGSPGEMLDAQLAYLVDYCSALTGGAEDAVSTAHSVLSSSQSLLTDPGRLRAWLFALARQQMLADAAPGAQEVLDLVHQHGIRAENLSTVLGIPPAEADQLLAAAENESASSALRSGQREADSHHTESWIDDRSWQDRAAAWDSTAAWDGGADWNDSADWDEGADRDHGADRDDSTDWDETFGPKRHGLQDLYGMFRKAPEPAGRHAAPSSGGGLRQALARGPVRVAAATAIVVAVIGVSAAYLAAANSPPPSPAGQQTTRHPAAEAQSPAPTPSPTPTATPTPSQPVTVVQPPPAATSPRPSPKPSPKPSPSPSTSPSPSSSASASASPSPSPL